MSGTSIPSSDTLAAWETTFGEPVAPGAGRRRFEHLPWTADHVTALGALARHALDHGTGLAQYVRLLPTRNEASQVGLRLVEIACRLNDIGTGWDDMRSWLTVSAAAPESSSWVEIMNLTSIYDQHGTPDEFSCAVLLYRYELGEAAPWGPLAWAAGLSPEEAAARHRSNDLTTPGLHALAGLRGYRFPAGWTPGVPVGC